MTHSHRVNSDGVNGHMDAPDCGVWTHNDYPVGSLRKSEMVELTQVLASSLPSGSSSGPAPQHSAHV